MNNWTFKVLSFGKTSYGQWATGILSDDVVVYHGIVQFDREYELLKENTYSVKTIDVKQTKNNRLNIKLGL